MAQLFTGVSLRDVLEERLSRLTDPKRIPSAREARSATTSAAMLGLTPVQVDWSSGVVVPATLVLVGPQREAHFKSMYAVPFTGSRELFHFRPDGLPEDMPRVIGDVVHKTVVLIHTAPVAGYRMRDDVRGWDNHQRLVGAVMGLINRQVAAAQARARGLLAGDVAAADTRGRTDTEALLRAG